MFRAFSTVLVQQRIPYPPSRDFRRKRHRQRKVTARFMKNDFVVNEPLKSFLEFGGFGFAEAACDLVKGADLHAIHEDIARQAVIETFKVLGLAVIDDRNEEASVLIA